jgi:hypothetical protein
MTDVMTRPDGRPYRPRKAGLRARAWANGDDECGVVIFGTLDPERAQAFADESCSHWYGDGRAARPEPGWYRDTFRYGERLFAVDEKRGAAGVYFTWDG